MFLDFYKFFVTHMSKISVYGLCSSENSNLIIHKFKLFNNPPAKTVSAVLRSHFLFSLRHAPFGIRPYGLLPHVRLRRIHLRTNMSAYEQAPGSQFCSSVHGSCTKQNMPCLYSITHRKAYSSFVS